MKVKATERVLVEKELDLEYPIYLAFQGELGDYTYVKLFPEYEVSIEWDYFGVKIERKDFSTYTESQILNNLTTEDHFNDSFQEAIEHLIKLKLGV